MNSARTHSPTPLVQALLTAGGAGPLPELLTLSEVCAFLKVKPSYIYSLTSTDRIPFRKFGGTLRFVKAELLQWLDRGRRGPR
ncbi:MAG TPA: helix-turn-helix domain-containing protein [Nitrospira sp.]|nr:helix-turn-helix domain-containing protein [Nitrospira sp.]